jgi:hypothetical protein
MTGQVPSGKRWTKFADTDLWLVPEKDTEDNHYYVAKEKGTYTFTFKE